MQTYSLMKQPDGVEYQTPSFGTSKALTFTQASSEICWRQFRATIGTTETPWALGRRRRMSRSAVGT
eukprot:7971885-Pyramimonas_sp.AAC.1